MHVSLFIEKVNSLPEGSPPKDLPSGLTGSCAYVLCAKDPGNVDIWHFLASLMVAGFCPQEGSLGERLAGRQPTVSATVYGVCKTVAGK